MIELLLLDVDGTLTDGKLCYLPNGEEFKVFDVQDGMGLVYWSKLGKRVAIISGRKSESVLHRVRDLGIEDCYLGIYDKKQVALELMAKYGLEPHQVACVGDDLNDLPMFSVCGLKFAPANAHPLLANRADILLARSGGNGAVREAIDKILQQENLEEKVLEFFTR